MMKNGHTKSHTILTRPPLPTPTPVISQVDRSVTGLVAQQQCVGPLHTPIADVAVTALSYFDTVGSATAIGEQPIKGLVDPGRGARMTVGEALTNLVFARITDLKVFLKFCNGFFHEYTLVATQGPRRGKGWGLSHPPPLPPNTHTHTLLLGNLVHTFDFPYERTHSRRRNAHKNVTFSKFPMHLQLFRRPKFQRFFGEHTGPTYSSLRLLTAIVFSIHAPPPPPPHTHTHTLQKALRGPCTTGALCDLQCMYYVSRVEELSLQSRSPQGSEVDYLALTCPRT